MPQTPAVSAKSSSHSSPQYDLKNLPNHRPLLITTGEPAGIGMDIVILLASADKLSQLDCPIWVCADKTALQQRVQQLYQQGKLSRLPTWQVLGHFTPNQPTSPQVSQFIQTDTQADFYLIDIPCADPVQAGVINSNNALMVAGQLDLAHELASQGQVSAIVTAPLQKSALIEANICLADGSMFSGHTEYFMQRSGCDKVVMMLANQAMKVALVTTHLPLSQVAHAISKQNVRQTVQIVLADLQEKFAIAHPRILVCGLNPHAGEGGHLGYEEIDIINPVLQEFQQAGVDISDAMPADTLFTPRHLANCDAVIAMYHDQGLPVLKSHGFGDTVNITLGLPYVRTSVDHGTALDLAGTGQASPSSLWQALLLAWSMTKG